MYIYAKRELKLNDEEYYTMSLGKFLDLCDTYDMMNKKVNKEESDIIVEHDNEKRNALKFMMG